MTSLAADLLDVANSAADTRDILQEPSLKMALDAIRTAAINIGRSWSGSNIGYHACVYCIGLQPKPAHIQFSREWGLKETWPTHTPNDIWQIFDHDEVEIETLRRAGNPNRVAINDLLIHLRSKFFRLKEHAISVLTVAASNADPFLKRKLDQIEKLHAFDSATVIRAILPTKAVSRDSLAVHQGISAAPHQCIAAIEVTARSTYVDGGCPNGIQGHF